MERLKEIINEVLENSDLEKITDLEDNMMLASDLGMDSLMLAELTVKIEVEYGIDIFEDGIVRSVGEIIKKLEGKK
jgi:acyl carrier protein